MGPDHPLRVGLAGGGAELNAVDNVAAIGLERQALMGFVIRDPGLGELTGNPSDLH